MISFRNLWYTVTSHIGVGLLHIYKWSGSACCNLLGVWSSHLPEHRRTVWCCNFTTRANTLCVHWLVRQSSSCCGWGTSNIQYYRCLLLGKWICLWCSFIIVLNYCSVVDLNAMTCQLCFHCEQLWHLSMLAVLQVRCSSPPQTLLGTFLMTSSIRSLPPEGTQ